MQPPNCCNSLQQVTGNTRCHRRRANRFAQSRVRINDKTRHPRRPGTTTARRRQSASSSAAHLGDNTSARGADRLPSLPSSASACLAHQRGQGSEMARPQPHTPSQCLCIHCTARRRRARRWLTRSPAHLIQNNHYRRQITRGNKCSVPVASIPETSPWRRLAPTTNPHLRAGYASQRGECVATH